MAWDVDFILESARKAAAVSYRKEAALICRIIEDPDRCRKQAAAEAARFFRAIRKHPALVRQLEEIANDS